MPQPPNGFKYQTVVRGSDGNTISDQNVSFRISILQDNPAGLSVYMEQHNVSTNSYGLANMIIGQGIVLSGRFEKIQWGSSEFFLLVELDPEGGSTYQVMGTTQLLSVPYAKDAAHAHSITLTDKNGNKYTLGVDSLGNPITHKVMTWSQCGDILTDPRDGWQYPTVKIGAQCWMSRNLNAGIMINDAIDQATQSPEIIEKYCYDNEPANCDEFGGLYQWNELMQYIIVEKGEGICPEGWHIPSDFEVQVLEGFMDSTFGIGSPVWNLLNYRGDQIGKSMKSPEGWFNDGNGTDEFGFTALPAGGRYVSSFGTITENAIFWTSSQDNSNDPYVRFLNYGQDNIYRNTLATNYAASLRCLKNYVNQTPIPPGDPYPEQGGMDVGIIIDLNWTCSDPNDTILYYSIYLGDVNPPPLVHNGDTASAYDPGVLNYNTTYYWKIVAYDGYGDSAVSDVWSFSTSNEWLCGQALYDNRDGQTYTTVSIGTQCWMEENLNIGEQLDAMFAGYVPEDNGEIEKLCYEELWNNCVNGNGGLYPWDEMMDYQTTEGGQGICPTGWHVPSDAEWCTLTQFIDFSVDCESQGSSGTDIGDKMKSTTGWVEGIATNESGFNAKPAGWFYFLDFDNMIYWDIGSHTNFWTSSGSGTEAFVRGLDTGSLVFYDLWEKTHHLSVRCMKD